MDGSNMAGATAMDLYAAGFELCQKKNFTEGYRLLCGAVEADPSVGGAWFQMGSVLYENKKWEAAAACYAKALRCEPNEPNTMNYYGWNLYLSGRQAEGYEMCKRATEINPGIAAAWNNRAAIADTFNRHDEAIECGRKAVQLEPTKPDWHMTLSWSLFWAGQWPEAFKEYEHRFKFKLPEFLTYPYPMWRGEKVGTLFVVAEQGLGDVIMALRFIPEVAKRADKVVLCVHGVTASLARSMVPENVEVHALPRAVPVANAFIPMLSIPYALGYDMEKIEETSEAYIPHQPVDPSPRKTFKVGIAWRGESSHMLDAWRSASLLDFLPLSEIPGVELHSLQVGQHTQDVQTYAAYGLVKERHGEMQDFLQATKVYSQMDLVITVDTASAHLAGAMGIPTWVLINQRSLDWRWLREGAGTAWYKSLHLLRRPLEEKTWTPTMGRVEAALREMVK